MTIEEASFVAEKLSVIDYTVFSLLMLLSALIGVYFAFFAKQKQNTTSEYLTGGKNMATFPITMSMIASYISGVAMLGVPAEIYMFGTQYAAVLLSEPLVCVVTAYVFMPVFYKLQLYSAFEYLLLRYDSSVRLLLSILYLIMTFLFVPLIIYVPCLAFAQVSGINMYLVATVTCAVCIFYTSVGGLKAVVWTDTLQSFSMIVGMLLVAIVGTIEVGGVGVVVQRASESGRFEFFNFDPNPLVRHTFWTVTIGNFFTWLAQLAANQALLQRCLALPSLEKAKRALNSVAIGIVVFVFFSVYSGLVIYAKYHDCDPVQTKAIRKPDQIVPFAVMDFAISIPGFPGLFIAGVFSAALSSMSTALNSLSGVILQEFIKPCLRGRTMSEQAASTTMKVIVVVVGALCTAMIFFVDQLGGIIQLSRTISGVTAGTMLGIFVLGMTVPWINARGALVGGVVSLLVTGWVAIGSQQALATGSLRFQPKPLSAHNCNYTFPIFNATINNTPVAEAFWMYRISYLYLAVLGFLAMVAVAVPVTLITGPNDPRKVNRDLLSPLIHRFLPRPLEDEPEQEMQPLKQKGDIKSRTSSLEKRAK